MNRDQASGLLRQAVQVMRARSHAQPAALVNARPQIASACGASGAAYRVELQVFWDASPGGNISVMAAIDDGGIRSFAPLTADFLMAPDGTLLGGRPA